MGAVETPAVGVGVTVIPCGIVGVGEFGTTESVGRIVTVGVTVIVGTSVIHCVGAGESAKSTRFAGINIPVPPSTTTVTTAVVGDGDGVDVGAGFFGSPITQPVSTSPAAKQIIKTAFFIALSFLICRNFIPGRRCRSR